MNRVIQILVSVTIKFMVHSRINHLRTGWVLIFIQADTEKHMHYINFVPVSIHHMNMIHGLEIYARCHLSHGQVNVHSVMIYLTFAWEITTILLVMDSSHTNSLIFRNQIYLYQYHHDRSCKGVLNIYLVQMR